MHRVIALAQALDLDLRAFAARACVVTGSNGKGSTAAMCAAILAAASEDVGLFTSPHLFSIHERFAIDGDPIDDEALARHWTRVEQAGRGYEAAHPGDKVGGFEFLFLLAASWFAEQKCRFTVWEAGIGGRYDPTRLVAAPRGALVSLDLEHTALLGGTHELIAYDKLDAVARGGRAFIGETGAPLADRIAAYCDLKEIAPIFLAENAGWRARGEAIALDLAQGDIVVTPPLDGPHQRNNTALAVRLAEDALRDAGFSQDAIRAAIVEGLAATSWPGRLEIIERAPPVVIDVGHTPDAIRLAREGFEARHAPCVLVCGASIDKAAGDMVTTLAPGFRLIVCAQARHKGRPAAEIAALAREANPDAEIVVAESMRDARQTALARAQAMNGSVYVAGGLFVAIEFKAAHLGMDPARLHFF